MPRVSDETLKALAKTRAVGIEDYMVEKHEADASRLVLCGPRLDLSEDAQPRVDLEI